MKLRDELIVVELALRAGPLRMYLLLPFYCVCVCVFVGGNKADRQEQPRKQCRWLDVAYAHDLSGLFLHKEQQFSR